MEKGQKKTLVLLDSHAIIHRAYHAMPDFTSSSGRPTGALYGLSMMLLSIIKKFEPTYIFAAFDLPKPTYRHEAYADYKSGRKKSDPELSEQIQGARSVFKAFNIPIYEQEGFEADDVIGTLVEMFEDEKDLEIVIASGDMDTMQLISDKGTRVFTLKKGIKDTVMYDKKAVEARFGFQPELLVDYKGLRGDPSDNIIGIPGIGEKTGTDLIQKFGTIEEMYEVLKKGEAGNQKFLDEGFKPRIINLLREHEEEALFSKMLATIRRDVPLDVELPKESWRESFTTGPIRDLFTELEFRSLLNRIEEFEEGGENETLDEIGANAEPVKEVFVSEADIKEVGIALWVLNSSYTNPTREDILHFANTDDLGKARDYIFNELKNQKLLSVFEELEKPLIPITEEMTETGIKVDVKVLKDLSKEYHKELSKIEKEIYEMTGNQFNINSPKQLAEVLFVKMGLKYKGMRKTSSGSYSTKEEVLHKLADEHEIAEKILAYRELHKLLSTYIDTIPDQLGKDGRLHPEFLQAGTTTGRMASHNPNIQNIPIKTELGRRIRHAFVAEKDYRLVAFDYSQVELRIAAILSGDPKLVNTFKEGKDIHSNVAKYVFDVEENEITKEMRVKAKTINFGILYGMGVSALQKNLKTDRKEAQKFLDDYFKTFKKLAKHLDETKADAARKGYTETLFGRRRYFEGFQSPLPFIRAQAERMAINAPIQGTQADVIKIAMIRISQFLKEKGLEDDVRPQLQIHDEVIFEIKESAIRKVAPEIKKIMESVLTPEQTKGVPIIANVSVGESWGNLLSL